jgi:hypothetical protein
MKAKPGVTDSGTAVILFHSTNHAMWAMDALISQGMDAKLVAVPRHLSSDCGYCVQISAANAERAEALLTGEGIEFDRIEV